MRERIAVVVAHIDDAEIWAGGTLIKYAGHADIVIYVLRCNDEIRKKEAQESEKKLNSTSINVHNDEDLYKYLRDFRPTILITHWEMDSHPEHSEVFKLVQKYLPYLQIFENVKPNVYCMETYNWLCIPPTRFFQPTKYINISEVWQQKLELIDIFESQPIQYWKDMVERQNSLAGAQVGVKYAECFIQLPVLGVLRCSEEFLRGNV